MKQKCLHHNLNEYSFRLATCAAFYSRLNQLLKGIGDIDHGRQSTVDRCRYFVWYVKRNFSNMRSLPKNYVSCIAAIQTSSIRKIGVTIL